MVKITKPTKKDIENLSYKHLISYMIAESERRRSLKLGWTCVDEFNELVEIDEYESNVITDLHILEKYIDNYIKEITELKKENQKLEDELKQWEHWHKMLLKDKK